MDFDVFVIGGGSGGVRSARMLAARGKRVGLAEGYRMGGTCVIRGCVPKKLYVYASEFAAAAQDAAGFGWSVGPIEHDWAQLKRAKDKEIQRLSDIYDGLLGKHDVKTYSDYASLLGPHEIVCGDQTITAQNIIIASGATPYVPEFPGNELALTSNEVFELSSLPRHATVIGGGYIALEFAHIFRGVGCEVTLVYRGTPLLRGFDHDVRVLVTELARERGIEVRCDTNVTGAKKTDNGLRISTDVGDDIQTGLLMAATGRVPNTEDLGLDKAGVTLGPRGEVVVNENSRTSVPHIFAVGDCTDRMALTPVAIAEAKQLVELICGGESHPLDYDCVPTAVFSQPPAAAVGLSEHDAQERGPVHVYESRFRPMRNTLGGRNERALMKLVVDKNTDVVLGAHMVGPDAPEIIQCVAIAVRAGLTKAQFDQTIALHPSSAEEFVLMSAPREPGQ